MTDAAPPPSGPAPQLSHMAAQLDRRLRRERRLRWLYFGLLLIPASSIVLTLFQAPEPGSIQQASTTPPPASTPAAPPEAAPAPPAQVDPAPAETELREDVRKTQATVARLERELAALRRAAAEERVAAARPPASSNPATPPRDTIAGTEIVATVPILFSQDGSLGPGTRTEIAETVSRLKASARPTRFEVVAALPDIPGRRNEVRTVLQARLDTVRAYLHGTLDVPSDAIELTLRPRETGTRGSAIELRVWQ